MMHWKGVEESGRGLFYSIITAVFWRERETFKEVAHPPLAKLN
jgi:hypothetical protein